MSLAIPLSSPTSSRPAPRCGRPAARRGLRGFLRELRDLYGRVAMLELHR